MLRLLLYSMLLMSASSTMAAASIEELRDLVNKEQYGPAVDTGEQLLNQAPTDRDALFLTAYALQMQQQSEKASDLYRQLIRLYPQLPEPRNNLAIILLQQENYQEAASLLVEALNTHHSYATAYRNLNEIYKSIASQAYQRAVSEQQPGQTVASTIRLDAINHLALSSPAARFATIEPTGQATPVTAETEKPEEKTMVSVDIEVSSVDPEHSPTQPGEAVDRPIENDTNTSSATPEVIAETLDAEATEPTTTSTAATTETATVAATASTAPVTPNLADTLKQHIIDWASAWSNKSFDDYIAFYNSDFSPRFETHQDWVEHRRQRILQPGEISVEVSKIRIRARSENRAVVDFEQRYASRNYRDQVVKRIIFQRFDNLWKITDERVLSVL